jgi:sn-glycerol 3-phosphate transport system ATP-binding protein
MVFQSYALFPHLSAADNILFGLSIRGIPRPERERRLATIVELLGISHLLDRRPNQLSGGQQQRVALGRALIAETPVCLLDEPLSNLDAQLRAEMRLEIRALQRRLGITMLFVTHDQTEAMGMADRIILMRDGRIEQIGTPADLYERPASTFVGRFIGAPPMNVIDLTRADTGLVVAGSDGPVVARAGLDDLQLGVRPEDVGFSPAGLPALVENSQYFGADSITACRVASQRLVVRTPGRATLAPGQAVHVSWAASAAHFFDKGSGLRREAPH